MMIQSGLIDILQVSYCELILSLYVSFTIYFLDLCQFGADIPTLADLEMITSFTTNK